MNRTTAHFTVKTATAMFSADTPYFTATAMSSADTPYFTATAMSSACTPCFAFYAPMFYSFSNHLYNM
jgi:hypothetical protein